MRVLWELGDSTARQICDAMSEQTSTALSTVQTLLRQLEAKGAVCHERCDRTFVFRALVQESEIGGSAAQDLLSRVFRGSLSGLVAHLLDTEEVSSEEMRKLREVVAAKEGEK
jgi:BlaI family penicillinase repressor